MRELLSIMLSITLVLSFTLISHAQTFHDVPKTHPNFSDIEFLVENGVIESDTNFGVSYTATRLDVVVMLAKVLKFDNTPTDTGFTDVPISHSYSGYISEAVKAGIVKGYPDGSFKPDEKVTRGHMAAFIARAFELPSGSKTFKDVPPGHTAYEAVSQLAAANITTGNEDGTFKPQENLTKGHLATFIARAIRYQETGSTSTKNEESATFEIVPGAPTSFKNCTELRKYYPNGVSSAHPAYDSKLDRDNDGWACER